jgi:hypothetical protein
MTPFYKLKDSELTHWLDNFVTNVTSSPAYYGLTQAQADQLVTDYQSWNTYYPAYLSAQQAAKVATLQKDEQRDSIVAFISQVANMIKARPTVTDANILELGLLPRKGTPGPRVPVTPTDLVATPKSSGEIVLRWSRGANTPTTQYTVETSETPNGPWFPAAFAVGVRVTTPAYAIGVPRFFRVFATRSGQDSDPSEPVVVYANADSLAA